MTHCNIPRAIFGLLVAAATSLHCSDAPSPGPLGPTPGAVLLLAPPDGDEALERVVATAQDYLTRQVGVAPTLARATALDAPALGALAATHGAGLVVVLDAQVVAPAALPLADLAAAPSDQSYLLLTRELGAHANRLDRAEPGATVAYTASRSRLGRQYALYELLRRLGARFYHPEEEYVPTLPASQVRARARTATAVAPASGSPLYTPDFAHRGYSFHGAHPLEHLEAFSDGDFPIDEAVRVNDWIVKNRGDDFRGAGRGVASEAAYARRASELEALRLILGSPRTTGLTLHNQQQGASAAIDPTSPVPVKEQIEALVTERLAAVPDAYLFSLHFGPTELTTTPDDETLEWLNWAGQKALALRPDVPVVVNDHTTGSQPVEHYDDLGCPPGTNDRGVCDYYDLAFHTDPRFGVKVHTVMFQPLEGPAGVYNQKSFAHKLCLMQRASAEGRRLTWFPEGSWWLSYDNPVPVYLPLYVHTRGRDMALIKPLLASRGTGTLSDHRMFNSGHEWGYWQQDYAVGLWHWNADVPMAAVLAELTDPLCATAAWPERCTAATETAAVLTEVMATQADDFLTRPDWRGRPGGLYDYFAGEDPADELAAASGLGFRPVRVAFRDAAALSPADAERLRATDLARLAELATAYAAWAARLDALRPSVPEAGLPWLAEIVDGLAINGHRAAQARALYDAALAFGAHADAAHPDVLAATAAADAALADAEAVIRRREARYRYPHAQVSGGGPTPDLAVPNGTTYPFRVHAKTHLLSYWRNRAEQVTALLSGATPADPAGFSATPVFAAPGVPLALRWPDLPGLSGAISLGDGSTAPLGAASHTFAAPGVFTLSGALESTAGAPLAVHGVVARTPHRAQSAAGDFALTSPDSAVARGVLAALSPAFHFAAAPDASGALAFAVDPAGLGALPFGAAHAAPFTALDPDGAFATAPVDFVLPIPDPSTGAVAATLAITGATFEGALTPTALASPIHLAGELRLADLVTALIALAGFDEAGAWDTLASVLGFDPAAPPETLPFVADLAVQQSPP